MRVFNSHVLIDPKGDIVQRYHKTHLFDVGEHASKDTLLIRTCI